jgi:hypothetical protein
MMNGEKFMEHYLETENICSIVVLQEHRWKPQISK